MYMLNNTIYFKSVLFVCFQLCTAFSTYKTFYNLPQSTKTFYSNSNLVEPHRKGGYVTFDGKGLV